MHTSRRHTRCLAAVVLLGVVAAGAEEDIAASVQMGIDRALAAKSRDEQQAAFDSILALGCRAVPAIVDRLDDRRKLHIAYIRLPNDSPEAFEAFRQYGPEVMTDALAAILNDITWKDCGFIFNGASESDREAAVRCWQQFARETPAKSCGRE